MTEPIIRIQDLGFTYPDGYEGLCDINLSIYKNEFLILAGRNGSGKSTLLRHLNGLLSPTSGTIRVNDKNVKKHLVETRKTVGMVFQDADAQMVGDTVWDEVAFGLENLKVDRQTINRKTRQVLEQMEIDHLSRRNPWTLSGGEKRKVAIAGVLVMSPEVIAFDEPFSNLDYPGALQVLSTILDLKEKGVTLIVATHEIETVISEATRMVILSKGRIVEDGPVEAMVKKLETYGVREPCSSRYGMGIKAWHT